MRSSYEHDVTAFVGEIWSTMLGVSISPDNRALTLAERDNALAGRIRITGAWQGTITLHCDPELARHIAAIMFDVDSQAVTVEEVDDALAELANMISGNFKSLLPEPCYLSLPKAGPVADGEATSTAVNLFGRFGFRCSGMPFVLSVHSEAALAAS